MKKYAVLLLLYILTAIVYADDDKMHLELYQDNAMQLNLNKLHGKKVIVILDSGAELEGTIKEVGTRFLHLEKITNRAFYQGVVKISEITTLLFKNK